MGERPATEDPARAPAPADVGAHEATILVVGGPGSAAPPLAARLLERRPGLRLVHAQDASDALKRLSDAAPNGTGGPPDLVLLGLPVDGVGREPTEPPRGLETLDALRRDRAGRRSPVLAVGGAAPPSWLEAAYRGRVNGYVVMPDDAEGADRLADSVAGYWLGWNHRGRPS